MICHYLLPNRPVSATAPAGCTSPVHSATCAEISGSGVFDMMKLCRQTGLKEPAFREDGRQSVQTLMRPKTAVAAQVVAYCQVPRAAKGIMAELGLKHWKTFQSNYLLPLMKLGIIERTIPDKPRSRLQRYRTTEAGLAALEKLERKR